MNSFRTRFAPTPSGFLHKGNAFSFLLTWLIAKQRDARILLRIDDLDSARKRPEYVEDVFQSLDWLELTYDEGPTGPSDFEAEYSQRHRLDLYDRTLERLCKEELVFACRCSRASILKQPDGMHPRDCQSLGHVLDDVDVAWRVVTSPASPVRWKDDDGRERRVDLDEAMRDLVVRRKDKIPSYQVASLADDEAYGVNLIVRGEDLLESTAAQIWLARIVGSSSFANARFVHHGLLTDPSGNKLSKSEGSTSLKAMREGAGDSRKVLFAEFAERLGLPPTVASATEALAAWMERKR